jgi:5'-3' exonuclease
MLLDAASLYFRAFYGVPESMRAPDGTPVNAVRGLLDFIARLVTVRKPERLIACFDEDWRPAFRVAAVPSYKAHRLLNAARNIEDIPWALVAQVPVILEVLDALGLTYVGAPGFEADDVIGTLATSAFSTQQEASGGMRSSTNPSLPPSTASPAARTRHSRRYAVTRATACLAWPA